MREAFHNSIKISCGQGRENTVWLGQATDEVLLLGLYRESQELIGRYGTRGPRQTLLRKGYYFQRNNH